MELERVTLQNRGGGFAQDFFTAVSTTSTGEFYDYPGVLGVGGRAVRSSAAHWGKKLGCRFSVRQYTKADGRLGYAVGLAEVQRKKRTKKAAAVTSYSGSESRDDHS